MTTKTVSGTWFEATVQYSKTMENGMQKKVKETYAVDALSFTECESRITEGIGAMFASEDFKVVGEKIAQYKEVLFAFDGNGDIADKWYRVTVLYITLNENTGKETRTPSKFLINANNIDTAKKNVNEMMQDTMTDYEISSIVDSKIVDVFTVQELQP